MRIKYRPSDFIVREELKKIPSGDYFLYLIKKENLTTWDVQHHLANRFRIPLKSLSFCGLKDRNAVTFQYMSSPHFIAKNYTGRRFDLSLMGKIDHQLGANDLLRNDFEIKIRDLEIKQVERLKENIDEAQEFGLPNYFDEQRFESRLGLNDFVARRLMLGQYEGALKLLIAQPLKLDPAEIKQFKRLTQECWGEWHKLSRLAPNRYRRILRHLARKPDAFKEALNLFDHQYIEFLVSAFQSYLWNEVAQRFLRKIVKDGFDFSYFLGRFYFYHKIPAWYKEYHIPIINHKTEIKDTLIAHLYDEVLSEQNMAQRFLRLEWPRRIKVKSFDRSLIVIPGFNKVMVMKDEYFSGKECLALEFSLPAGSYATLLIKRIIGPKLTGN